MPQCVGYIFVFVYFIFELIGGNHCDASPYFTFINKLCALCSFSAEKLCQVILVLRLCNNNCLEIKSSCVKSPKLRRWIIDPSYRD